MRIGELSRRTGVPPRLPRYHEEQELIHPERQANGYRDYPDRAVDDVLRIRGLLRSGLPTRVIRDVLPRPHGPGDALTNPDPLQSLVAELGSSESRITCLIGEREVMLSDALRLADTAVATRPDVAPGMAHGRHLFAGRHPAADKALADAVAFAGEHLR